MLIRYDPSGTRPQTVLVVCTANICRSPLVQGVLRHGFADAGWLAEVDVLSAGTNAEADHAMCDPGHGSGSPGRRVILPLA